MFSHKFQVLTAVLMKVKLFWDMKLYQLVPIHHTAKNTNLYKNFLVVTHLTTYFGKTWTHLLTWFGISYKTLLYCKTQRMGSEVPAHYILKNN